MDVVSIVLKILLLLCSLGLIAVVLMQPSEDEGLSAAITGINPQSFLSGTKDVGRMAFLAKMTKIFAFVILLLTLSMLVIDKFFA